MDHLGQGCGQEEAQKEAVPCGLGGDDPQKHWKNVLGIETERVWKDTPCRTGSGVKALWSWAVQAAWSMTRSVPVSVPPFVSAGTIKKPSHEGFSNWNDSLAKHQRNFDFYPCLVCKHSLKGCSGREEGISSPSQLLLARSSGRAPQAPALLGEHAASGLKSGREERNSSGVWC